MALKERGREGEGGAFAEWLLPDGRPWLRQFREAGGYRLEFAGLGTFGVSRDGRNVEARGGDGVSRATLEHLYWNQVLPMALSRQRRIVFHASAVEVGGVTAGFLGQAGQGKSTLAGSFAVSGGRFLTDDGLIVGKEGEVEIVWPTVTGVDGDSWPRPEGRGNPCLGDGRGNDWFDEFRGRSGSGYWVMPSHPSIRLWSDSQSALVGEDVSLAPGVSYTSKARILADQRLAFCDEPRPLGSLYFLGDGSARSVVIEEMKGSEAVVELVKHSFLLDIEEQEMLRWHFDELAELVSKVPCKRLDYPRKYGMLAWVRAAVTADLAAGGIK